VTWTPSDLDLVVISGAKPEQWSPRADKEKTRNLVCSAVNSDIPPSSHHQTNVSWSGTREKNEAGK